MHFSKSLLLATLLATQLSPSIVSAAKTKPVVAVLPFGSPARYSRMGQNAQPTFITELVKSRKVRVSNEKLTKSAIKRFAREESGLYNPKKIRQMGRFLKADYVVSGQLSYTGDAYTMTVHVTNVETLELEMAEDVDFRHAKKMRLAVRTAAKRIAALVNGEEIKKAKHEAFYNLDPRAFYDTADACIASLRRLNTWKYRGEVEEELDGRKLKLKITSGSVKAGLPLQVIDSSSAEEAESIGVLYVEKVKGRFVTARWIKEKDPEKKKRGDFGIGTEVSSEGYQFRVAAGPIEDEAEGNEALVKMFKEKLKERMDEEDFVVLKESGKIAQLSQRLSERSGRKAALKKLHKLGVDFILEGKFIGAPSSRRADFKLISTSTGKLFGRMRFETRI